MPRIKQVQNAAGWKRIAGKVPPRRPTRKSHCKRFNQEDPEKCLKLLSTGYKSKHKSRYQVLVRKDVYGIYAKPVDRVAVPDYYEIIKNRMDFNTIRNRLSRSFFRRMYC